jgi:hypothetical protein
MQAPVAPEVHSSPLVTVLLALIATILPVTGLIIGYLQWRTIQRLGTVKEYVDGKFAELQKIANDFAAEVVRLQQKDATTPYGEPSAEHPVTLSAGLPVTKDSAALKARAEKDKEK